MNFETENSDVEYDDSIEEEHFEEVSCELQHDFDFDDNVDVTTTYLGKFLAQGGSKPLKRRTLFQLTERELPWTIFLIRHQLRYSLTQEHLKAIWPRNFMIGPAISINSQNLEQTVQVLGVEMERPFQFSLLFQYRL